MTKTPMKGAISLRNFLLRQLLFAGGLLTLMFGMTLVIVYQWGLDDTTEYYLYQDADWVVTQLDRNNELPASTPKRQFYIGYSQLPQALRQQLDEPIKNNHVQYLKTQTHFIYLLSYSLTTTEAKDLQSKQELADTLFVIHQFPLEDEYNAPGLSLSQIVTIVGAFVLLFILLTALLVYRVIASALFRMEAWCQQLPMMAPDNDDTQKHDTPPDLHFAELQQLADRLHFSTMELFEKNQREKSFIRCLSHELRTPIAVIGAALDLLQRRLESPNHQDKLTKIRHANQRMLSVSDTLLNLWQQQKHYPAEEIAMESWIKECVEELSYMASSTDILLKVDSSLTYSLPEPPLRLIVLNLLKNAFQYTHQGDIVVNVDATRLSVSNDFDPQEATKTASTEYGYGLGLWIASALCEQQGWTLHCETSGESYVTTLEFT
ncbi:HAMP domain-containing sensor histidine kinase [Pleionea sp. CnH1-48]|uniref:sensor histidine kinase n=1 Tax=Pleionea sp. CnH1-48 TaxID=2954494 RepID=UPI002098392A|nr:HAMP domain-containing sensor histidine kinase [Pleionea sp. CnH1-48]MCO7224260.1 HAMP domain-containing histidine kinase [Pleionea sp. CnH1-48]